MAHGLQCLCDGRTCCSARAKQLVIFVLVTGDISYVQLWHDTMCSAVATAKLGWWDLCYIKSYLHHKNLLCYLSLISGPDTVLVIIKKLTYEIDAGSTMTLVNFENEIHFSNFQDFANFPKFQNKSIRIHKEDNHRTATATPPEPS